MNSAAVKVASWKQDELETISRCSLCGAKTHVEVVVRPDRLPIHECTDCGFAFLGRRPNAASLAAYYANDYFENGSTYQGYYEYAQAISDLDYCPRVHRLALPDEQWRGKRVLEVGCAAGATLVVLRRRKAHVRGIELSEEACRVARDHFGLELVSAPLEAVPLAPGSIDVALAFDVIEHVPDAAAAMGSLIRALTPGGRFAMTVPNYDRFASEGPSWQGIHAYWEHLNYFKSDVLVRWLEAQQMKIVALHTFTAGLTGSGRPQSQLVRDLKRRVRSAAPVMNPILRRLRAWKFKLFGPPHLDVRTDGTGFDLFVMAEKLR